MTRALIWRFDDLLLLEEVYLLLNVLVSPRKIGLVQIADIVPQHLKLWP